MAINFDTGPYYDDFDPSKNFHRILFKPGYAVQARELTQSQTILQNQISEFASAVYSQNTPVTGGQVTTNFNCFYLKLNPTYNGQNIKASNFANQVIFDSATGTILARVIATVESTSSGTTVGDPPTLIVSYLSGTQFTDGLTIQSAGETSYYATIATATTTNATIGPSSTASIANGVFYIVNGYSQSASTGQTYSIGNFVDVVPQTIVLDKYDNSPNCRIGLEITETIYDYVDDPSLLDPAIGASNYQAPGADRYVISLSLVQLPLTLGNDQSFIELLRIVNGEIVSQVNGTSYSTLDDYFAKRDYETNGDYIVNDFSLTPTANSMGVSSEYDLKIGKGVAYVHGYRVENQSPQVLTNQRARNTNSIIENAIYVDYGNYITVDTINGVFDVGQVQQVFLHCVGASGVNYSNTTTFSSTIAGTAFLRNLTYVAGSGSNTKTYVYNAYLSDFTANTLSGTANTTGSTPTTLVVNDTADIFSATANAYTGVTITATTGAVVDVRTITQYTSSGATKTFTVTPAFTVTPSSATTFTLNFNASNINSMTTPTNSAQANVNAAYGKLQGVGSNPTLLNNPGSPELIFPIGYQYVANLSSSSYYSQRVYRNKSFTGNTLTLLATSGNGGSPLRFEGPTTTSTGTVNQQNFIVINTSTGNILDFTSSGNTITISSDKTTATFYSATYAGMAVDIIAQVSVSNADNNNYVLKSKNLVGGNTTVGSSTMTSVTGNTFIDLTNAQALINKAAVSYNTKMSLYVTDIKNIVKIYDTGSSACTASGTALSSLTDITNFFTLDNGQRDSFYDFGSLSLIPGAPLPSGNLLVVFNYYSHTQASSGDGYFSLQSYMAANSTYGGVSTSPEQYGQLPVYTAKDGSTYKLRDCVDFRTSRVNGQTSYIWEYSTGTQPSGSSDVGVLIPQNLSNFQSNYGYYLGRNDLLVLTKDQTFQIVNGNPSSTPQLPAQPAGTLLLANLYHDPYTAYVPGEGPAGLTPNLSVKKVLHKRWAKSDITDLETRINNLEYYTSLSVMESTAASTQVVNSNGVARPNYGILVDDFSGYATADSGNADYAAKINIRQNQMGPVQVVNNFQLQNPAVLNSLGTLNNTNTYAINSIQGTQTNIFTLPYTAANVITQPLATSVVSANPFSVVVDQGVAQLTPPMDNWVDNSAAPAILVTDPNMQVYQASAGINLTNAGDFQTIPGTSSSTTTTANYVSHNQAGITSGGVSPYGYVGFTQTTTQTYSSQLQNVVSSAYNPTSSTFATNNGYLTNIAILPYIRQQQIIVQAAGLLVNSPIYTWFDGVNVDKYMTSPNTIELTGVSGTFNSGDVVGFYISSTFYPIARVLSVYNYPNGTQSRLYVADTVNAPNSIGTSTLVNGTFDVNGNYVAGSQTASGTVSSSTSISLSGEISGVGGGYANVLSSNVTTQLYLSATTQGYSSFLNLYGVWGDPNNSTAYNASFPNVSLISGQTYTLSVASSGTASVVISGLGTTYTSPSNSPSTLSTYTITAPSSSVTVGWNATSSGTTESAFALTIADASGTVVFSSIAPPNLQYINGGTQTVMYGGGAWFQGVYQVYLGPNASSVNNYYQGSQISIQSNYIYGVNVASTYVPPTVPNSQPTSGGGGGCCVVATALTERGEWSPMRLARLEAWALRKLDNNKLGSTLHRGYHVIGPKALIPMINKKGIAAKYITWSFNNATNMLQGKKYNKLSVLNTLPWMAAMFVTGLFVSQEKAESIWKSLYKDKK